jgi:hypothetical protein
LQCSHPPQVFSFFVHIYYYYYYHYHVIQAL